MLMSVSGPNFVTDPKKELAKMDQTVHMTNYRRHVIVYSGILQLERKPATALWMQSLMSLGSSSFDPIKVLVFRVLR